MPLDPQAQVILEAMSAGLPFEPDLDIDEFRTQFSETSLPLEAVSIAKAEDRSIPGPQGEIPIRIYTPEGDGPVSFGCIDPDRNLSLGTGDGSVLRLRNGNGFERKARLGELRAKFVDVQVGLKRKSSAHCFQYHLGLRI